MILSLHVARPLSNTSAEHYNDEREGDTRGVPEFAKTNEFQVVRPSVHVTG